MRARMKDELFQTASVADELKGISVESEGKNAIWTEEFLTTSFTKAKKSRTATIVENERLLFGSKIFDDGVEKFSAKITIFRKIISVFRIDNFYFR